MCVGEPVCVTTDGGASAAAHVSNVARDGWFSEGRQELRRPQLRSRNSTRLLSSIGDSASIVNRVRAASRKPSSE